MLYIYSGDVPELDKNLKAQIGTRARLTVIPTCVNALSYAKYITSHLQRFEIKAKTLPRNACFDRDLFATHITKSAAVYLCGGNTYEFLQFANDMHLFPLLRAFEENGGVIAAESAGSIILSHDIATAAIPSSCPDENLIGHSLLNGMGRIPFHISPHFNPDHKYAQTDRNELQTLANISKRQVLLLEDGEGFIMDEEEIIYFKGQQKRLQPSLAKHRIKEHEVTL